jgi:hypothetical protein
MDNALIATGLAFAVTVLTSLFKTVKLSTKQKQLIVVGLSLVAGVAQVATQGVDLSLGNITTALVQVYGASQIAYNFILRGTKLNAKLTNTNLFGTSTKAVEQALEVAAVVEKAKAPKKTAKKAVKKAASPTRVKKD